MQRAKDSAGAEGALRKGIDMAQHKTSTALAGVIHPCLQCSVRFLNINARCDKDCL